MSEALRQPPSTRTIAWRSARCAVGCALALFAGGSATAEDAGDTPIATCGLAPLPRAQPSMLPVGIVVSAPTAADGLSMYRKDAFGDWPIADEVDPDDPSIHLLLATPDSPIRVRVEVLLAGAPFRGVREAWIDAALSPEEKADAAPEAEFDAPADPESEVIVGREMMAPRFQSAAAADWLASYARSSPAPLDRTEARWLLAQRAGGPSLVEMVPSTTPRTAASPLRDLLDLDGDGGLDRAEIDGAVEVITRCDFNEDGDIDRDEVRRATPPAPARAGWKPDRLLTVVEGPDADAPPDLVFRVRFNESIEEPAVSLTRCNATASGTARANQTAIAATLGGADVEFTAAGAQRNGQVSVGSVIEGEPLWSRVDTNHDNRLSQRELTQLTAALRGLDRDGDGQIGAAEMPTRIRLAVATGANVHALLSAPATPPPPSSSPTRDEPPAPEWFVSMDANSDGDLSRAEFLGGEQQFAGLDTDADGLISPSEAAAVE